MGFEWNLGFCFGSFQAVQPQTNDKHALSLCFLCEMSAMQSLVVEPFSVTDTQNNFMLRDHVLLACHVLGTAKCFVCTFSFSLFNNPINYYPILQTEAEILEVEPSLICPKACALNHDAILVFGRHTGNCFLPVF